MNHNSIKASPLPYLISSARPKTLLAVLGPILLGLALAYEQSPNFSWMLALLILATGFLLQISTNLVNDYGDYKSGVDSIRSLGPARLAQAKNIAPSTLKRAFSVTFFLALLCGLPLMQRGGVPAIAIGVASLLAAYCYTAGPVPLSYFALGEVLALIFFGPVAVSGTYLVQTGVWSPTIALYGLIPGVISAGLMALNNFRDRQDDAKTKKKTLALYLGEKGARLLVLSFLASAPVLVAIIAFYESKPLLLIGIAPFFIMGKKWQMLYRHPVNSGLNAFIPAIGKFLLLTCLATGIALLVSAPV